jgi:hypothetical protein
MGVFEAFDEYQKTVDADPVQVKLARDRRAIFTGALSAYDDVVEVIGSGSLQRSTQLKPIHDVDLIMIFERSEHEDWGLPGESSAAALEEVRSRVSAKLGATNGEVDKLVRLAKPRNRAVKCFIDPPEDEDAFTVDVMPALRTDDGHLLLPSTLEKAWTEADPEWMIRTVATKNAEWSHFRPMVRALKKWRKSTGIEIKSLVMEVLAVNYLPLGPNRPEALRAFFTSAAVQVNLGVTDPAGFCGPIQPDLDLAALSAALSDAADNATKAVAAAGNNDQDGAQRYWQKVFGDDFPAPPATSNSPSAIATAVAIKDSPQGSAGAGDSRH